METLVQAPAWVKERREHASRRFAEVGFPTTRNEDWRFTNISPIAEAKFPPARGSFKQAASLIERSVPKLRDQVALSSALGNEHYEISAYQALIVPTSTLGLPDAVSLLQANLDQEVHTSEELQTTLQQILA